MRVPQLIALLFALAWALAQALLTSWSFWVARGSDVAVSIYGSSPLIKFGTVLCVAGVWVASVKMHELGSARRWALRFAGLLAIGLATHLVVINGRRCVIEEHWFNWVDDRVPYSCADGLSPDWLVRRVAFGFVIENRHDRSKRVVFTGVPPWRVELEDALSAH